MIYSASRRTDLPAFYPDYIVEKIRRSRKLDGVVYWTKDIRNFAVHFGLRAALTSYPSIIQYTVTGLAGSIWEPEVPSICEQLNALSEVLSELPAGAVQWRFDPIIADNAVFERFARIYEILGHTGAKFDSVVVSFPDLYRKVSCRLKIKGQIFPDLTIEAKCEILEKLYRISGLKFNICCEGELLDQGLGFVEKSSCVSAALFKKLYDIDVDSRHDSSQRSECGCTKSTDIGSYKQRCFHKCLYCYANPEK